MIKSAVTISLVEQARQGPFVFHGDLADSCQQAGRLGFDAIELFAPSGEAIREAPLRRLLSDQNLRLAAVGTGAGMVVHGLHLCDAEASRREAARDFIRAIIDAGAEYGAPAIIGSMQGRWDQRTDKPTAVARLRDALHDLGEHARLRGVCLIYEPLNRYETNLAVTLEQGVELLRPLETKSVKLLADLFHMNIEETCLASALRQAGEHLGHVHFVDSNRQAAGRGHLQFGPIAAALVELGYSGYASAEAFPLPDSETAARQTIETFRKYFPRV